MAIDLVSCTTPPFAALYAGTKPEPKYEYMLARLMILPPLRLAIDRAVNCESKKHAFRCVSIDNSSR